MKGRWRETSGGVGLKMERPGASVRVRTDRERERRACVRLVQSPSPGAWTPASPRTGRRCRRWPRRRGRRPRRRPRVRPGPGARARARGGGGGEGQEGEEGGCVRAGGDWLAAHRRVPAGRAGARGRRAGREALGVPQRLVRESDRGLGRPPHITLSLSPFLSPLSFPHSYTRHGYRRFDEGFCHWARRSPGRGEFWRGVHVGRARGAARSVEQREEVAGATAGTWGKKCTPPAPALPPPARTWPPLQAGP